MQNPIQRINVIFCHKIVAFYFFILYFFWSSKDLCLPLVLQRVGKHFSDTVKHTLSTIWDSLGTSSEVKVLFF